ncbi:uncharacterized protein LOC106714333 [Papilio machaon]|uniref:uncharacterized protein LOC106714333 n=1 Tax=Papilio machaon TaxID=76193 RepID=UPI001E663D05|nr:uncharacterized protein LOC106714333 [Papilio machaon]
MAKKKIKSKSKTSNSSKVVSTPDFNAINAEAISSATSSVNQSILKVCRLCESKDGPFHNIFDSEKVTAKKIEELMPFWVAENDDLPHKICFRCSAKVEELYEFVQKCVGTQESLRRTIGKTEPLPMKKKTRALWEQSLNKSNMSNDDICHALIKKAMEGIKDIVKPSKDIDKTGEINVNSKIESKSTTEQQEETDDDDDVEITDNEIINEEKNKKHDRANVRALRSNKTLQNVSQSLETNIISKEQTNSNNSKGTYLNVDLTDDSKEKNTDEKSSKSIEDPKPFDIMDHVTMIKVNGVGVLFQCKLCNRNFLKKEVVLSHGCAKTGVPKIDKGNMYIPPEPPKPSTVKYINTRVSSDNKNQQIIESKPAMDNENSQPSNLKQNVKKKIGPASKTGRRSENTIVREIESSDESNKSISNQVEQNPSSIAPQLNFMTVPNMSSRYKILPGPNNTFTLVEDKGETETMVSQNSETITASNNRKNESSVIDLEKVTEDNSQTMNKHSKKSNPIKAMPKSVSNNIQSQTVNLSSSQPYPVGLFQTNVQAPFTTPAMKKQSYTVVQTGNPNKLLISTKPQDSIEEMSKKRLKKTKAGPAFESKKEPFSVILEDATPNNDTSFFTFVNVDPLLQPSYVLPTDSIIQESQITTSTQIAKTQNVVVKENDKYSCNICGEIFNREKKLSAHINAHYNVDNDYIDEGPPKKRGKK